MPEKQLKPHTRMVFSYVLLKSMVKRTVQKGAVHLSGSVFLAANKPGSLPLIYIKKKMADDNHLFSFTYYNVTMPEQDYY